MNDFENIFGGEDLTQYSGAQILFDGGESIELEYPVLIAVLNDNLYLKDKSKYIVTKNENIYKITLIR